MVSDKLQALYDERTKRKAILELKPDTKWASSELKTIENQIKQLEAKENKSQKRQIVKIKSSDDE